MEVLDRVCVCVCVCQLARGVGVQDKWGEPDVSGVICNKYSMINVFKEESPLGRFKLIRKSSCEMMNALSSEYKYTL